jgi:hypothetical protein
MNLQNTSLSNLGKRGNAKKKLLTGEFSKAIIVSNTFDDDKTSKLQIHLQRESAIG